MAKKVLPLALGAGAVALAVSSGKKKKKGKNRSFYGVSVKDCNHIKVTDGDRLNLWIRGASAEIFNRAPETTPLEATVLLMEEVSRAKCPTYPDDPGSAEALLLTDTMLRTSWGVYRSMPEHYGNIGQNIVEQIKDYVAWYARYELKYAEKLLGDIPKDSVGFLPDYSKYYVGPKFWDLSLAAYVKGIRAEGGSNDDIFDTFAENQPVLVGVNNVVMISELPQGKPAVQDFLTKIASKIQEM